MEQRLSLIPLGVSDVSRAQAFYEKLRWHLEGVVDDEGDQSPSSTPPGSSSRLRLGTAAAVSPNARQTPARDEKRSHLARVGTPATRAPDCEFLRDRAPMGVSGVSLASRDFVPGTAATGFIPVRDKFRDKPSTGRNRSQESRRFAGTKATATGIRTRVSGLRIRSGRPVLADLGTFGPFQAVEFGGVRWSRGHISGHASRSTSPDNRPAYGTE
jgi:hypothetical protein